MTDVSVVIFIRSHG